MDKKLLLENMVKQDPEDANLCFLLGLEYMESALYDKALHAFSQALQKCDENLKTQIAEKIEEIVGKMGIKATNIKEIQQGTKDSVIENDIKNDIERFQVIPGGMKGNVIDLEQAVPKRITFSDVGGLEELKETIRMKIIKPFINPSLFAKFNKKTGGGILLFGPPGCGKTFIAKATSGECQAKFIPVHITDILDPYIGVSESNLKDIFSTARAQAPCVLFFDEIDAIGYHRGKGISEHRRSLVDQLLSEMEGIDTSTDKLLVIGATNMPWDVDPAFKRPGRFDKLVFVPPPDLPAREAIFRLKLCNKPTYQDVNYEMLATKTEYYSGADIENVVEVSTEKVISEIIKTGEERPLMMKDLLSAVENSTPSTLEWLKTIKNYVKYANQGGLYNDVDRYLVKNKYF